MNNSTKILLDQIVEDMNQLKKKMFWEMDSAALGTIAAFLFAGAGRRADVDKYVECKKYLKKHVSVFSEIRGIAEVIVITKMCLADDYEEYLSGVMEVYKKLRSLHKLTASPYMVMAAVNIYEGGGTENADSNIAKLEAVYKEMKSEHFWLTGDDDRPFIAMMVSRDINFAAIASKISDCYEACKDFSLSKEAMHTASQILALSGKSVEANVADMNDTINALKDYGLKGMRSELMPMAAALVFVDASAEDKAKDIKEIYDYLKGQKGFKWLLSGGAQRSLYSILVYVLENINGDSTALNSVINTTLTNIIIEEIILTVIVLNAVTTASTSDVH